MRCRAAEGQSFLFTFADHDGSVGAAAAVPPLRSCARGGGACPVLLSMHGTGVSASDQADSYKREVRKGEWDFGVRGAWVLAPSRRATPRRPAAPPPCGAAADARASAGGRLGRGGGGRHGAHNWEGTGQRTALAALRALGALTRGGWGAFAAADAQRVLFAGHSMGGHGAALAAAQQPDLSLALASAAVRLIAPRALRRFRGYLPHGGPTPPVAPGTLRLRVRFSP